MGEPTNVPKVATRPSLCQTERPCEATADVPLSPSRRGQDDPVPLRRRPRSWQGPRVIEGLAVQVIAGLPSGTDLNAADLQQWIIDWLDGACPDLTVDFVEGLARCLLPLGYLTTCREEPGLYFIP